MKYIAIDYDDTLELYPDSFKEICDIFREQGVTPVIVTARSYKHISYHLENLIPDAKDAQVGVVFCHWLPKAYICKTFGIRPMFWIDDSPEVINRGWDFGEREEFEVALERGYVQYLTAEDVQKL